MPNFSRANVVLVRYPFTDLSEFKVRPAVVISGTGQLSEGEFLLAGWQVAGLNVPTAVKRGIVLVDRSVILKTVGSLAELDFVQLRASVVRWLELS